MGATEQGKRAIRDIASGVPPVSAEGNVLAALTAAAAADVALALTAQVAAAPVGGTGATAGAYDTAANRDTAIAAVNNNRTRIAELETDVNDIITKNNTLRTRVNEIETRLKDLGIL